MALQSVDKLLSLLNMEQQSREEAKQESKQSSPPEIENAMNNMNGSSLSMADQELLEKVKKDNIEYIRFERCDLYCRSIGKLVPIKYLKNYLLNGIDIPKPAFSIVANYNNFFFNETFHNTSNVKCFPYHTTYSKLPSILCSKANIGRIMYYPMYSSNDIDIKTRKIFNVDARTICLNILSKLKDEYKMNIYSSFEHEFSVFHKTSSESTELIPLWKHKKFMDNIALSEYEDFIIDCERSLSSMNVNLENMHLEFGPGCYEWTMKPKYGIQAADDAFTYKTIIKQIGMKYNYKVSFATTPECDKTSGCSNGAHFNHSLWNDGNNVFYDEQSDDKISIMAKYWIGGIFKHIQAITCFAVPTINCYRRVRAHSWSPALTAWGFDNRQIMIRVKRGNGAKGTWLEYRLSCCACNPYLVMISIIIAGIDGIKNKILPPNQPIDDDCNAPKYEGKFERVSENLGDALDELVKDDVICKGFGEMFIESFVAIKRMEIESFNQLTKQLNGNQVAAEQQMFSIM